MSVRSANSAGITALGIWCLTPLMLALMGNMPPFLIGGVSFLTAFVLVVAWWLYRGENIISKFKMPLAAYALGTFGIALYNVVYIYAFKTGPFLEVNLLNYLWPALLIIFGGILQKSKPDAFALAGIVCCFIGAYFIFESRGPLSFSGNHLLWLGLLCAVMWGTYSTLARFVPLNVDQVAIFFLIAGALMTGLHLIFEETVWPVDTTGWGALAAYVLARIAFFMWDYAMKQGQTQLIASFSYFIPLFATLALMGGGFAKIHSTSLMLGTVLIVGGCVVINFKTLLRNVVFLMTRGETA